MDMQQYLENKNDSRPLNRLFHPFFSQWRAIHCLLLRQSSRVFLRHVIKSCLKRLELALRLDLDMYGRVFAGLLSLFLFFH